MRFLTQISSAISLQNSKHQLFNTLVFWIICKCLEWLTITWFLWKLTLLFNENRHLLIRLINFTNWRNRMQSWRINLSLLLKFEGDVTLTSLFFRDFFWFNFIIRWSKWVDSYVPSTWIRILKRRLFMNWYMILL